MVNMKCEDKCCEAPEMDNEYPYGLCLSLTPEDCDKLGCGDMAAGDVVTITAKAVIKRKNTEECAGEDPEKSMMVQITDMEMGKTKKPLQYNEE